MLITKRTVFVLGAGASEHLGFPLAAELKEDVIEVLRTRDKVEVLAEVVTGNKGEFMFDSARTLADNLEGSHYPSIDAFLKYHPSRTAYEPFCRVALALALLPYEDEKRLLSDPGWYNFLFQFLLRSAGDYENFQEHAVSFVTFNYDRSLEHFLITSLQKVRGAIDPSDSLAKVKMLGIHHVCGHLGLLPSEAPMKGVRFGPHEDPGREVIERAVEKLELVPNSASLEVIRAREKIERADYVFFLGFGYHRENLELLLPSALHSTQFRGTAFHEPPMRLQEITAEFREVFDGRSLHFFPGRAEWDPFDVKCEKFVEALPINEMTRE